MADAVIGALRVVLGADTAAFETGLKHAKSTVADFGASVSRGMAVAAASFAAASLGMGVAIKSALSQADNMGKAAQKMGIPVEELSKLQHAAALSDVSLEQLGTGVGKLSKNLVESLGNPSTAAARSLAALGISAKDSAGQIRPTSDVISDIAEKFAGMKDGAGKTALAMFLFGKSGADLIPMLNSGKVGLQEMKDEAAKLGLVITDKTAKSAEAFNDNLTKLRAAGQGVALVITARLAPALADISSRFISFVKDNDLVTKAADGLTRAIVFVADNVKVLGNVLGIFVGARIVSAVAAIALGFVTFARSIAAATLATTLLNAAKAISIARIAAFAGVIIYATGNMPAFVQAMKDIGTAAAGMLPKGATDSISQGLAALGLNTDALTKDIAALGKSGEDAAAQLKKLKDAPKLATEAEVAKLKQYQTNLANLGMQTRIAKGEFDGLAPGFAAAAMQLGLFGDKGQRAVTTLAQLTPAMLLLNAELLKNAAVMALQTLETPYDKLAKSVAGYDMMLKANEITVEEHRRLSLKAAEDIGLGWQAMGGQLASFSGSMSQLAGTFAKDNKAMGIASKAFGIAQAVINTQIAATKALSFYGPTPLGFAAVAAAVAQGVASVASISAQSFAKGGLVTGPGTGISDSINARLSAGEFVMPAVMTRNYLPQLQSMRSGDFENDYSRGFGSGNGGPSGTPTVIQVRGFDPKQLYSGDQMRDLIDGINSAVRDGHVIEIKPI